MTKNNPGKVMVFGTFDGLHPGHVHFLLQARQLGKTVIAVLTHDATAKTLKARTPQRPFAQREAELAASGLVDEIIPSDEVPGSWEVISLHAPAAIALGYDQAELHDALAQALKRFPFVKTVVRLEPYRPERYHSRLLRDAT